MALSKNLRRSFFLTILIIATQVQAYCRHFKQSRNYYTTASPDAQIVSQGYVCDAPTSNPSNSSSNSLHSSKESNCNATSECSTVTYGVVNTVGSNNLSLVHDDVIPLYALIPTKTSYSPPSFLYSLSGNLTYTESCIKAHKANGSIDDVTTAGYYAFIPTLLCIEGTLSKCENGPVQDGTAIQICAVNAQDHGIFGQSPNGAQRWINTDLQTALNLTFNPASTRKPVMTEAGKTLEQLGVDEGQSSSSSRLISFKKIEIWTGVCIISTAIGWWI